jgi:uncharacterized protein YfaP (DUF2135 family)
MTAVRFAAIVWATFVTAPREAKPLPEPPRVQISAPRGGWTQERLTLVAGFVSDRSVRSARVFLNGDAFTVNVHDGRFEVRLPVVPGENFAEASARNEGGVGRDSVSFMATTSPTDLVVLLTWDTLGTDLDLRVTDPDGVEVFYGARRSPAGGVLEVDDTDGFGPEVFVVSRARAGEYRIAVSYYDAAGLPKTEATVEVIASGGTRHERRERFAVTLTHEGETVDVGNYRFESPR